MRGLMASHPIYGLLHSQQSDDRIGEFACANYSSGCEPPVGGCIIGKDMILFVIILIALAAAAQYLLTGDSLRDVQEEFHPEVNVAEPGEVFWLHVTLKNTGRRYLAFLRFSLFLPGEIQPQDTRHCTLSLDKKGCTITYSTWLRPYGQADFRIPVRIAHRGRYVFRPLHLYGGDFLGLNEQMRSFERFREVVVAPKESEEPDMEAAMGGFVGDISVRRFIHEDPVLSAGFREYTGQEPMKKISWTQSARGRGLMVRNDDYTVEPTVSVILNVDAADGVRLESLEACCRLARTVCRMLEDQRIPYDLVTNTVSAGGWFDEDAQGIRKGFGAIHFERVLELLGRATDTVSPSGRAMWTALEEDRSVCGRILITAPSGMPEETVLRRLREISDGNLLVLTPALMPAADNSRAQ